MTLTQRLEELERRVAALEAAGGGPAPPPPDQAETFWALEGLRQRVSDPGAVLLTGAVMLPDGRTAQWQEGDTAENLLGEEWADQASALAALGHPVRLRLLHRVLSGGGTIGELSATEGVGTSGQVYHHLRQLIAAGWLRSRGSGTYEVPVRRVVPLLVTIVAVRR